MNIIFAKVKHFLSLLPIRTLRISRKIFNWPGLYYCPICEKSSRKFYPFGNPPRANAQCPRCGSFERHRMDWVLLHKKTNLFDNSNKSLLHVAPEPFFEKKFRRIPNLDYLSADLYSPKVMVKMDITDIQYPDNYFSAIYCSHVLEHVEEDRKALAELYRVLKEEGWAILEVPLSADKTYEDPSIKDPAGREQVFGQRDHVRLCGPDYIERMREAGFKTETILSGDLLTSDECLKMGIQPDRILFFCRK